MSDVGAQQENEEWAQAEAAASRQVTFQLGNAELDGRGVVVVRHGDTVERLDELVTQGPAGAEQPRSVKAMLGGSWDAWLDAVAAGLPGRDGRADGIDATNLGPAVTPSKLVCIGSNYGRHIAEMHKDGGFRLQYPYSFLVPPDTGVSRSGAEVAVPSGPEKVDWEGEIGVVIARDTHNVTAAEALEHVAGYVVMNDLCVRDYGGPNASAMGIDWVMSKAYDGFKPVGPYLTPSRFIDDPQDLRLRTWVNGVLKQDGEASDMLFTVAELIEHLASIMTLRAGDLIATGTPPGVGHGRKPPEYLHRGDRIAVEIAGLDRVETLLI